MDLKVGQCTATPSALLKTAIPHASFDKSKYHLEYYYDLNQCTGAGLTTYTKKQPGALLCDTRFPTVCPGSYKLVPKY